MDKKSLLCTFFAYVVWGLAPFYWRLLANFLPLFTLANRIVWGALFLLVVLLVQRHFPLLGQTLRDKSKMKFLLPAALLVGFNWGLYIWSVVNNHLLDASMGYFICPLLVTLCSRIFFREAISKTKWFAFFLALAGVLFFAIANGEFPFVALGLAVSFTLYGIMKKMAHVDNVVSTTIETLILLPFALLYVFTLGAGSGGLADMQSLAMVLLMVGAGILTTAPLIFYAQGVNSLPLSVVGFLQYVTPTMTMLCGLSFGETLGIEKLVCFICIWLALVVFSVAVVRQERLEKLQQPPAAATQPAKTA